MRPALVAANWKMHGSVQAVSEFAEHLQADVADVDVLVFPPSIYLAQMSNWLAAPAQAGAQDIGIAASGAHTGEIAAEMVRDVGGLWTLLGHSERRLDHEETDDLIATKVAAAIRGGLRPIVCVGETLAQREAGQELAVVMRQLEFVLDRVSAEELAQGAVAYEPVWAIGTGQTATSQQAQEMHEAIRGLLAGHSQDAAEKIRIAYGGSVNADNAAELFSQPDIDGGLVGGASLDVQQFNQIIQSARQTER